jgi:hypothetical protein
MHAACTEQRVCLRTRFLACCTDARLYKPAVRAFIDLKVSRQWHSWWHACKTSAQAPSD